MSGDESEYPGPVCVAYSMTDPGDMGEPREVYADGVMHVTVPDPRLWARSERVPDGLRTALTDLITVAEAQPHDPGSMLGVALANARSALAAPPAPSEPEREPEHDSTCLSGQGPCMIASRSAPAPSERCDNCPHPGHDGWCPARIPGPTGDTDPCSCYAGTRYAPTPAEPHVDDIPGPHPESPDWHAGYRAARNELAAPTPAGLDVDVLRRAIYAVSVRHDWEHTTDREDRTEEIAAEYAALLSEKERGSSTPETPKEPDHDRQVQDPRRRSPGQRPAPEGHEHELRPGLHDHPRSG